MSTVQRSVWKCDRPGCGHEWFTPGKTEKPKACAKCKTRNWDTAEAFEVVRMTSTTMDVAPVQDLEVGGKANPYARPDKSQTFFKPSKVKR